MAVIEAIATQYLEVDVTSVTFSSIPATYEHLQLRINAKSDYDTMATASYGAIRFNGDTSSVYGRHLFYGNGSSIAADAQINNSEMYDLRFGSLYPSEHYGTVIWDILDYANTNKNTTSLSLSAVIPNALQGDTLHLLQIGMGYWDDTSAVDTILIDQSGGSNFMRGSVFTLYGLNSS